MTAGDAPQSEVGCPDGGTCHHYCLTGCWRVATVSPMTAYGDHWSSADRKAYGTVVQDWPPDARAPSPAAEIHWGTRAGRVLRYLHDHLTEHGYPPTMREIGAAVGLTSSSSVAHQLAVLQSRGHIKRDPNKPRALTIYTVPPPREQIDPAPRAGRCCRLHDDPNPPCAGDLFLVVEGHPPYVATEVCAGHLADLIPQDGATVHRVIA